MSPKENWHRNFNNMENSGGCTRNGTCPLVPRKQNGLMDTSDIKPQGGCTRNGTCPLVPREKNGLMDTSDIKPQGGCTRNGTCPLVPRKQIQVSPTYAERSGACTKNGTCPLIPHNPIWHSNVSSIEQGGCTRNGTCSLMPRKPNLQVVSADRNIAGGCTQNFTCPLVPRNQTWHRNISEAQGGCTRNGTCPLVPRIRNPLYVTTGVMFEEVSNGNGARPYNQRQSRGSSKQEHNAGCTRNCTFPLVPLEENQNFWEADTSLSDTCARNGRCPLRPLNQDRPMHIIGLEPSGECTCPLTGYFEAESIKPGKVCNEYSLRPWKPPIYHWHLSASDMEINSDCLDNECPIIRCKINYNPGTAGCQRCIRKAMYQFKKHNQFWQVDARDIELNGDCITNGISPNVPLHPNLHFDCMNATPAEGCIKNSNTMFDKYNTHRGNVFQHNEECECTFCRIQYRPCGGQYIGEPQCCRNGLCRLAGQNQGQYNAVQNAVPTECNISQNPRYNIWDPRPEAKIWNNGNTTFPRVTRKQNQQTAHRRNEISGCQGRGPCTTNPRKYCRSNTQPTIRYQRIGAFPREQNKNIISHNSTNDELVIQCHKY